MRDNPVKWSCFELHKVLGRPAKEVAEELGITPDLVYQNVSRILKQIRQRCLAVSEEELVDER
jgi:DNA-directed RNA polymerase specialized sigma24 family protein